MDLEEYVRRAAQKCDQNLEVHYNLGSAAVETESGNKIADTTLKTLLKHNLAVSGLNSTLTSKIYVKPINQEKRNVTTTCDCCGQKTTGEKLETRPAAVDKVARDVA